MRFRYQSGEQVFEVSIERHGDRFTAQVDGVSYDVEVLDLQPGQVSLRFAGRPVTVYLAADGPRRWASLTGCAYPLDRPTPRRSHGTIDGHGETVRAPMPAQVRAILVAEGDTVEKGQTLLLLEAMKMEIRIKSPTAGKVTRLLAGPDQAVDKDQLLVEIGE